MEKFLPLDWRQAMDEEFIKPYFKKLTTAIEHAYQTKTIYPKKEELFSAFSLTPLHAVKVVLLGQDPYHGVEQAHGLAFSVRNGVALPPSLKNIFKEITHDIGRTTTENGDLTYFAKQGVLLLNSTLTVESGAAGSHCALGWEEFTNAVISRLSEQKDHLVYMLWGAHAHSKAPLIDNTKHLILSAPHPSPLSAYRGFFGCKHFSRCNEFLQQHSITPIKW